MRKDFNEKLARSANPRGDHTIVAKTDRLPTKALQILEHRCIKTKHCRLELQTTVMQEHKRGLICTELVTSVYI